MSKNALAVAVEALSWMAYTGIGERTALLKSSRQLQVNEASDLRQAHKWIMETNRFQNRLDWFITQTAPEDGMKDVSHGIRSLLRILAYMKFVDSKPRADLERTMSWGRQIIGWRTLLPYEQRIGRLVSGKPKRSTKQLSEYESLALETCHPPWYVQRLITAFGRSFALNLLRRDLFPVSTFARVNPLKTNRTNALVDGLHATQLKNVDGVYILDRGADDRGRLASAGQIVIQDLGSIVAGLAAAPQPGKPSLMYVRLPATRLVTSRPK